MKKIVLLFSLILFFSVTFQVRAQWESRTISNSEFNFQPLNTGNIWQYLKSFWASDWTIGYSLSYIYIEKDTIINNFHYYKISEFSNLIRYSEDEKKLFFYHDSTDKLYIDFTVPDGNEYQSFLGGEYRTVSAEQGYSNIFNLNRAYGGYLYIPGSWGYNVNYSDSIGMFYDRDADNYIDVTRNLIQAKIIDTSGTQKLFSYHYKPAFVIQPITTTDSLEFIINFNVNHHYTKIVSGYFNTGLDFIDSVKMISYYSNDDTIIWNQTIIPNHSLDPVNNDYVITFDLDTSLMKNGFTFNYRFTAKDKGIIPEYASVPDTGYFQCIWDETSSIQKDNRPLNSFLLQQNYPNPFNPSTTISWQAPVSGWQTLKIYDILGNEVATLVDEYRKAGNYEIDFLSSVGSHQLANGVYFYQLRVGDFIETKKMILLK